MRGVLVFALFLALSCGRADGPFSQVERGYASYYADEYEGRETANGEFFSQHRMTAAHKTLPLGTWVAVCRTDIEKSPTIIVRINDRGPYIDGRIIDLTRRAARALGIVEVGYAAVEIVVLPNYRGDL